MKSIKYIFAAILSVLAVSSCTKELSLGNKVDESKYQSAVKSVASVRDNQGKAYFHTVEVHTESAQMQLTAALTKKVEGKTEVSFCLGDESVIDKYNKDHGTSYNMFPKEKVVIDTKAVAIDNGAVSSTDAVNLSISLDETLTEDFATYAIPVVPVVKSGDAVAGAPFIVFVKDYRACPDNTKYITGTTRTMTLFNCMESQSNDIRNNLAFRLKNSGKYLIDCALLFTNDIVFNKNSGELEISAKTGPDAQAGRPDTIIEEMHRCGVKVILCITNFGVTQLNEKSAKEFAKKVAQYCSICKLDGVFIDDEYTELPTDRPDFLKPSAANGARLCYEMKMAMPDKLVVTYLYSNLRHTTDIESVDGVPMKDIVDFALNNYGESTVPTALPKSQVAYWSDNFASGYKNVSTDKALKCTQIKNYGYGAHFFYQLSPGRWQPDNEMSGYVRPSMINICKVWFGDEIDADRLDNWTSIKTQW